MNNNLRGETQGNTVHPEGVPSSQGYVSAENATTEQGSSLLPCSTVKEDTD